MHFSKSLSFSSSEDSGKQENSVDWHIHVRFSWGPVFERWFHFILKDNFKHLNNF